MLLLNNDQALAAHRGERITVRRPMEPQPPAGTTRLLHIEHSTDKKRIGKWVLDCQLQPSTTSPCPSSCLPNLLWTPPHKPGDVVAVGERWAPSIDNGNRQIVFEADGRWGSPSADGQIYFHGWVVGITDKVRDDWANLHGHWLGRGYFGKWQSAKTLPVSRTSLVCVSVAAEMGEAWEWVEGWEKEGAS